MDEYLDISYKLESSENFDEYMKALGVNILTRKLGNSVRPTLKLTKKDGVYTLFTTSSFKNYQVTFQPDVEFDEVTVDGRKVKSIIKFDGNKLIHTQNGDILNTITQEYKKNEMMAVLKAGDVVCTRVYKKVN